VSADGHGEFDEVVLASRGVAGVEYVAWEKVGGERKGGWCDGGMEGMRVIWIFAWGALDNAEAAGGGGDLGSACGPDKERCGVGAERCCSGDSKSWIE
jgi:hypothetical protein